MMLKKMMAELFGTYWLVFGGCGAALLAAGVEDVGVGWLGVAFAFGLTVVTMAYGIGHISGAHLNPAVSIGLLVGKRMPGKDLIPYIIAQLLGASLAALTLSVIVTGNGSEIGDFAANGYGEHSPQGYDLTSAFVIETVMTFIFLLVIIGATDGRAPKGFGGLAIGLCLTLIHIVSIPVTNTSVNPARSFSQAIFVGDWAISQLWLFIVAPILGAVIAGLVYNMVFAKKG